VSRSPAPGRLGRLEPDLISNANQSSQGTDVDHGLAKQDLDFVAPKLFEPVGSVEQTINDVSHQSLLGRVASTCLETAYGSTVRLSYQIKVF
jgi:hypothetical protein